MNYSEGHQMDEATEAPAFTFKQARQILALTFGVHESKLNVFEVRIQELQRRGLPMGINVGRSARARYTGWHLAELTLYLDLIDAGVMPAVLKARFAENLFYDAGVGEIVERSRPDQYLVLHLNALDFLRSADSKRDAPHPTDHSTWRGKMLARLLRGSKLDPNAHSPPIVINLTARLRSLKAAIAKIAPQYAGTLLFPPSYPYPGKEA